MTALAHKAGVGVETVRKLVYGASGSSSATIAAVAQALHRDVRTVARWAAEQRAVAEPFELPAEADLLTDKERRAIVQLVRAITADRKAGGSRGDTAPIAGLPRAARRVDPGRRDPNVTDQDK